MRRNRQAASWSGRPYRMTRQTRPYIAGQCKPHRARRQAIRCCTPTNCVATCIGNADPLDHGNIDGQTSSRADNIHGSRARP